MTDWKRTKYCGELRAADVGSTVTLNGWLTAAATLDSSFSWI